jgi:hypothetical protein
MPTNPKKLRALVAAVAIGAALAALSPNLPRDGGPTAARGDARSTSDHAAQPMSMIERELVEATLRTYGY